MRLHQVLCERLGKAVVLAEDAKALKNKQVSIALFTWMVTFSDFQFVQRWRHGDFVRLASEGSL